MPATVVDAVLPRGAKLTLDLCEELRRLAPFGLGNPDVTLLAPGCELGELATVGDGKHLRFRVHRDGRDAGGAIAFGQGAQLDRSPAAAVTTSRSACRRTTGTARSRRSSSCAASSTPTSASTSCTWLRAQWRAAAARDARRREIFDELEVERAARSAIRSSPRRSVRCSPSRRARR